MVKSGCLLVLSSQKKVPNHFRKSTCKLSHNKLRTMKENSQELIFHFNARCFAWGESWRIEWKQPRLSNESFIQITVYSKGCQTL